MIIPVTAFIVLPLFYSAWQRRKRRKKALSDPQAKASAVDRRAMRLKDWATAGVFGFGLPSAGLAGFEFAPRYRVPPAIAAAVAFGVMA
jgi:hypothetical protein